MDGSQPQATSNKLQDSNTTINAIGRAQPSVNNQTQMSGDQAVGQAVASSVGQQQTDLADSQQQMDLANSVQPIATRQQPISDQQQSVSTPQKELLPTSDGGQGEKVPLVELKEEERIPEDVQGWVEKIQSEDVKLPEPIQDHGKVVLSEPNVTFKDDRIVLPLTQQHYTQGMKQKVNTSVRWLVEWCGRLIKMLGDRAKFRETQV